MINSDYRPRLAAEITPEMHSRLMKIMPRGLQKPLFQAILQGVFELYDRGGMIALGAIISRHVDVTTIVDTGHIKSKSDKILMLKRMLRELENGND